MPRGAGRGGRGGEGWGGQRSQLSPRSLHHGGLNPKLNPKLNSELNTSQLSPRAPREAGARPHTARPQASTVRGFLQRPLTARVLRPTRPADVERGTNKLHPKLNISHMSSGDITRDGGCGGGGLNGVGEGGGRESSTESRYLERKYLRRIWAGTHVLLPQRFPAQSTVSTLQLRDVTWT